MEIQYIKGKEIITLPKIIEVDGIEIALSDEQLRQLGFKPIDEVVMEQAEILSGMAPDAETIRQRIADSLIIKVQALPYMIGFTWQTTIVDNEVRFKLVPNQNGLGTPNNPVIFAEYVLLIPNAYYLYEGEVYKYKGLKDKATTWEDIVANMEKI